MNCKVLIYNSKSHKSEWINGTITGIAVKCLNENFQRFNVLVNGIEYLALHPHCVTEV